MARRFCVIAVPLLAVSLLLAQEATRLTAVEPPSGKPGENVTATYGFSASILMMEMVEVTLQQARNGPGNEGRIGESKNLGKER